MSTAIQNLIVKSIVRVFILVCASLVGVASVPHASNGAEISGLPRVVDGDTLEIGNTRIRIHGIDAPEARQTCMRDELEWLCGLEATKAMRDMTRNVTVSCVEKDTDRYGRIVGVCYAGGTDVGEALVKMGLALAYRNYSRDYVGAEASAKASRSGMWVGSFIEPWNWRRGKRLAKKPSNDNDECRIKGNISSSGERIYHVPGGQHYDRTKITESKGERWFCSEFDATDAGWRKSKR